MNKYEEAYKRLSSKTYQYADTDGVYEDINVLGELVKMAIPRRMKQETYEKALKLACEYFGGNDCPYSLKLDFKGCLKDDCRDECSLCWQRYFLEKAEENNENE